MRKVIGKTLIFTILYNRLSMLKLSALNVVTYARNARYVLWDNGNDPQTTAYCQWLMNNHGNPSLELIYHKSSSNIGLNAARQIMNRYADQKTEFLMSMDEDILYLPFNFQTVLQAILRQTEKRIGYVACNVFQDSLTNGAKPPATTYREEIVSGHRILLGPTGGWASMSDMKSYNAVGGYEQRPELFFGLDGLYRKALQEAGIETCLAKDCTVYHATGPTWNSHFKYDDIHALKMDQFRKSNT